jgi:hypothetical protein
LEIEVSKMKNDFKWRNWSPDSRCPLFESDKFDLPKTIAGIEESLWVTSKREFSKCLPEVERNTLLTGDPE